MDQNQVKITPELIIEVACRRRWVILVPLFLILIGGIYYAKVTPKIYQAKTLILVEGQSVPQDFVRSIVTENTSERINTISQQIMSRTNLEKIVQQFSLFSGPGIDNMYMEDKINILRNNIEVSVTTDRRRHTDAFEIRFKGKDPTKVTQVVNGLAASFIDENLKERESLAIGTSSFLESELVTIRNKLEQYEEKIKNYRKENMGELPDQLNTNLRILERMQNHMSDRQQNLREAKIRLADLKSRAAANQPQVVTSVDNMIAELSNLQARYTEEHPDIIRLKKQIAEMKSKEADETGKGRNSVNYALPPVIRDQVNELQHEIQINEIEIQTIEAQIAAYQQRVENTPKREQGLLGLTRDYQNIQKSYDSLLNRKLEANIAVNMERKQKGEQFRI